MKNKALAALEPLIGEWEYTMYNAWFLESMDTKVKGTATIERIYDSFVALNETGADQKPGGTWIIGYSDPQERYEMFYYDPRGTARIFEATFDGKTLVCHREDKDMYQRMTLSITVDGLHAVAEASDDKGKTWRKDLKWLTSKQPKTSVLCYIEYLCIC
jgi:hypothetical protein